MSTREPEFRSATKSSAKPAWNDFREPVRSRLSFPSAPFARLGLTHAAAAGGDALVAIALAKTLFFVSPNEAKGKVLLYLLVTLAPFAVVSPFIGPLIDRFAKHRKTILILALAIRGVLCFLLMRDYDGWGLFPETFALLVLSKGYAVARNAVIPSVVTRSSELVRANSKLALLGGIGGVVAAPFGGLLSLLGPGWVAFLAAIVFGAAASLAGTLILADQPFIVDPPAADDMASGSGRPTAIVRSFLTELRLAVFSMSALRLLIGMVTFLAAFTLKREGASTSWLGIVATAGIVGGLLGSAVAPKARGRLDEMRMLLLSLVANGMVLVGASLFPSRLALTLVAFIVGFGASVGRLAFDALLQRHGQSDERGAAFARSETRFQLAWVLGALIPVATQISRTVGFGIMAFISVLMVLVQVGGERSLRHIDGTLEAGRDRWHRPARPNEVDWNSDEDL